MSNVLLGIIAFSVLVMAVLQVAAAFIAAKALKGVADAVAKLDADVRPIVNNLQQVSADAAKASSLAVAQVERIDQVMSDVARHVERTAAAIPQLIESARDSFSVLGGLKAVISAFQEMRRASKGKADPPEDEDPLFVG